MLKISALLVVLTRKYFFAILYNNVKYLRLYKKEKI